MSLCKSYLMSIARTAFIIFNVFIPIEGILPTFFMSHSTALEFSFDNLRASSIKCKSVKMKGCPLGLKSGSV